jgi:predicted RNase H-like HicB family nuclease
MTSREVIRRLIEEGWYEVSSMKKYAVIYERGGEGEENWGAYVPDLPGCITTGDTLEEVQRNIQEAIQLHLEELRAEGLPVPELRTLVGRVETAA